MAANQSSQNQIGHSQGNNCSVSGRPSHSSGCNTHRQGSLVIGTTSLGLNNRSGGSDNSFHSSLSQGIIRSTAHSGSMSVPSQSRRESSRPSSMIGLENLDVRDRRRDGVYGAHNFARINTEPEPRSQSINPRAAPTNSVSYGSSLYAGQTSSSVLTQAPFHGYSCPPNAPGAIMRPTSDDQLRSTTQDLPTPADSSAERDSIRTMRGVRSSNQHNRRRGSTILRSDEDLNGSQEERPWHEDRWPGFDGCRQSSNNSTGPSSRIRDLAQDSEPDCSGPTVAQGYPLITGHPNTRSQLQPSLMSGCSGLTDMDETEDTEPESEFLPFVQLERPLSPLQHSAFNLSTTDATSFHRFDIDPTETEFARSVRFRYQVDQSLSQTFGLCEASENSYTSPNRVADALKNSKMSLKRKRGVSETMPQAHIYVQTNDPNFNIFNNGLLMYPEMCFALAAQMPLRDLISLYAISKDFHIIIDSRFTTICLSQVLRKAPESAKIFRFRSYAHFCRTDPVARIPHPNPAKAEMSIPRTIPSFRWIAFILHREKVVHELITVFAERGCPLPRHCSVSLKKMWLIMDIPENARRIGIMHSPRFVTDIDLYYMMCVIVKLDMIANDPLAADKRDGLRRLLFSQEGGLAIMNKVLKREMWRKQSDFLAAHVRCNTSLEPFNDTTLNMLGVGSIFGVPRDEVGIGKFEYWGKKGIIDPVTGLRRPYLIRPDQLVQREAIRRGINFSGHYFRCVLYGYVDPETLENVPPRERGRRITEWNDEDYDILDSVGGLRALSVEDGGDPLLDLGDTSRGSPYIIKKEPISKEEQKMRDTQDVFTKRMYELSKMEQDAEKAARKEKRKQNHTEEMTQAEAKARAIADSIKVKDKARVD